MNILLFILLVLAVATGVTYILMKKKVIKDENNNGIPDSIDNAVVEVKEKVEVVKKRAQRVKEEVEDVVKASKKIVDQAKDVAKAANGSTRKGAKKKSK